MLFCGEVSVFWLEVCRLMMEVEDVLESEGDSMGSMATYHDNCDDRRGVCCV